MSIIKRREWDSNFFNLNVGEIFYCPKKEEIEEIERISQKIISSGFQFVLYKHKLCEENNLDISVLSRLGFNYIDTHITLSLNLKIVGLENSSKTNPLTEGVDIRLVEKSEKELIPKLQEIGEDLSKVSRFALDSKIPHDMVELLYQNWIRNGFESDMADHIYVAFGSEKEVLGFAYFLVDKEDPSVVDLSLLAVHPSTRGSGLGSKLMKKAFSDLEKNYDYCTVIVSLKNSKALSFYEKMGYRHVEAKQIYHAHYEACNNANLD
jgi:dTDP-4-amino-4,6-dideoxy-D-galactose acyltransferase